MELYWVDFERQHWLLLPSQLKSVSLSEYLTYAQLLSSKLGLSTDAISSMYPKTLSYTDENKIKNVRYALAYVRNPQSKNEEATFIKNMEEFLPFIFGVDKNGTKTVSN